MQTYEKKSEKRTNKSNDSNQKNNNTQKNFSDIILEVKNLSFNYPRGKNILNNISFSIKKGEAIVIVGENGSGKSTLFYCLAYLLEPSKGKIIIDNKEMTQKNAPNLRMKMGLLFQDSNDQLFLPSVKDELQFAPKNQGLKGQELKERIDNTLKTLHLEEYYESNILHTSYGEKKRIAFGTIYTMDPPIFLLDEPFMSLDPYHRELFTNILTELHSKGKTLILISHELNQVPSCFKRALVMHKGEIIYDGKLSELYTKNELLKKANLRLPLHVQLYNNLQKNGLIPKDQPIPDGPNETFALIEKYCKKN